MPRHSAVQRVGRAMEHKEPLREVLEEADTERLLQALRRDMPHAVHVVNVVENVLEWRRTGRTQEWVPAVRHTLYRYKEDGDSVDGDVTVLGVTKVEGALPYVFIHTTEATGSALRRVLADSAVLPWNEDLMFESVHERCVPALLEAVHARGGSKIWPGTKMYLPKEEALAMDVSCPPGYTLLPLEAKHGAWVAETWGPKDYAGAVPLVTSVLVMNRGLSWGVFEEDKTEGSSAAHVMADGGYLRNLYTAPAHRCKGLAGLVLRATCRNLAARGKDLHANVERPNPASEATFEKLGFRVVFGCDYVLYKAPWSSL